MDFRPKAPPRSEMRFCATQESCDFTPPGTGRERHRRHRVNLLRRSSAGAAVLADDTPPTAPKRFIMAGWIHPAMIGPAVGWNTPRSHSSRCWKSAGSRPMSAWIGAVTRSHAHEIGFVWGMTVRFTTEGRGAARRALSGTWWGNHDVRHQVCGYVLLAVTKAASVGVWADYEGGGQVPDRAVDTQDQARRGSSRWPGGGHAVSEFCKKFSHPTDACRSVGAERNRG